MFDLAEKLVEREINKGIAEGIAERLPDAVNNAVNNKIIEFAKKLLKHNTPIEIIMDSTGLDVSTIEHLQSEMDH